MRGNRTSNAAIVIGWINYGKAADCGETMKNQLMIQRLTELGVHCRIIDIKGWLKRHWVFFQLAWDLVTHKKRHNHFLVFCRQYISDDEDNVSCWLEAENCSLGYRRTIWGKSDEWFLRQRSD